MHEYDERTLAVAHMATLIYCDRRVYQSDEIALRLAVGDALLILDRVEEKFKPKPEEPKP
jgi:hypothetical protein